MNEIVSRFQSLSADDWWALGLCCFLGVCLLTWAVTETWERGVTEPATATPAPRRLQRLKDWPSGFEWGFIQNQTIDPDGFISPNTHKGDMT